MKHSIINRRHCRHFKYQGIELLFAEIGFSACWDIANQSSLCQQTKSIQGVRSGQKIKIDKWEGKRKETSSSVLVKGRSSRIEGAFKSEDSSR
jgi:hypothetical protein